MNEFVQVRDARIDGRRVDVTWCDGRVTSVTTAGSAHLASATVVDAAGGEVVPGLHDHHIHLLALAAHRGSVVVGPPVVTTADELAEALDQACRSSETGWVRAVGYHESVAGTLDADLIERLSPASRSVAVRVQHRTGQLWTLNSVAMERIGHAALRSMGAERVGTRLTGQVFGLDDQLRNHLPPTRLDVAGVGAELASYGVTGVTDLTPIESVGTAEFLADQVTTPTFPLRVTISGGPSLEPGAGSALPRGPVKLLPPDHEDPDLEHLVAGIRMSHHAGRPVAIHCVTRVGLVIAVAAWRTAGSRRGDRIEHGAVIPGELIDEIRELGLLVVTQPNFIGERGDQYLADVDADDLPDLWRCRSLLDRGLAVAGGTDAPFGHPDPWRAIATAADRCTPNGVVLGAAERIGADRAFGLFLGRPHQPSVPRRVLPGAGTDLCVLDRTRAAALADPRSTRVVATVGRAGVTFARPWTP